MSQPSARGDRATPAPPPGLPIPQLATATATAAGAAAARATHDSAAAIDRYVQATFESYRRVLVELVPTLAEPRVFDSDLALRRLSFLVETLAGFAIGAAIGAVATAVRRGFGDEVRAGVGRVLGRIARDGTPRAAVAERLEPAPFLRGPARPLLDALGSQLHARLCAAAAEVRAPIACIHAEVERAVPARLRAFAVRLDQLVSDDLSALAFAEQLAAGWRCYAAAVTGGRAAAATGPWKAWVSRLAGPAPSPEPTREQLVAQGYLVRIA